MYFKTFAAIKQALQEETGEENVLLVEGGDHADLASTIAFALAKKRQKAPVAIAGEIAEAIRPRLDESGVEVTTFGPYINFIFGQNYVNEIIFQAIRPGFGALRYRPHQQAL